MAIKGSVSQPGSSSSIGDNSGPTTAYGTGVPSASKKTGAASSAAGTPVTGSLYIRQDGTAGARIYWFFGGSWVAQTTP